MGARKHMRNAAAAAIIIILVVIGCLLITIFSIIDEDSDENNETVVEVADEDEATVVVTTIATRIATSSVPTAIPANTTGLTTNNTTTGNTTTLAQPTVAVQSNAQTTTGLGGVTTTTCTPNTAWPVYVVQAGDTLETIAIAAGSTTVDLTTANCLTNSDIIYEGQQLYVPAVQVGNTGVTTTGNTTTGTTGNTTGLTTNGVGGQNTVGGYALTLDPYVNFQNNTYTLRGASAVRITWTQLPPNAVSIDFFFTQAGTNTPALITPDVDLTDGAIVTWTAPQTGSGLVHAIATLADGSQVQSNVVNVITQ